jgi:hypothetical protein
MLAVAEAPPQPPMPNQPKARLLVPTISAVTLAGLLSATATVDEKRQAILTGLGLPQDSAALVLHLAPVLLAGVLVPMGSALIRGRSKSVQFGVQAGLGGLYGLFTGLSLNLFAGLAPWAQAALGPLNEAGPLDNLAWLLVIFCVLSGALMVLLSAFGTTALQAISTDTDPECATVRRADRKMYGWSAVGLLGFGATVAAIALLNQAQVLDGGRLGILAAIAVGGVLLYLWSSIALWRSFDELFRRIVVESLAWSGAVATAVLLAWTILEAAELAPPVSAYGVTVFLLLVQTIAPTWLSIRLTAMSAR